MYEKLVDALADAMTPKGDRLSRLRTLKALSDAVDYAMWDEAEQAMRAFNPFMDNITAADIAAVLGKSRSTFYRLVDQHRKRKEEHESESD